MGHVQTLVLCINESTQESSAKTVLKIKDTSKDNRTARKNITGENVTPTLMWEIMHFMQNHKN